jgi:Flp pilus assembly protein TadD
VNFEVWENLLYLDIQVGQYDNAINHSEKALEMFPNQGMLHYFNGVAHLQKRHYEEAIFGFEQAKKLSGRKPALVAEINGMLGDAYNATKAFDKSDKAYDDALAVDPNNNTILNNYSYYLALRKFNLEKAEKMSALLVKNNPDNPTFLDTYAWVLYTRQKYKEARKVIERAVTSGNANATHIEHYGDILFQLGDVTGAVQQWEKARGLNANSETLNKKIANRKIYE